MHKSSRTCPPTRRSLLRRYGLTRELEPVHAEWAMSSPREPGPVSATADKAKIGDLGLSALGDGMSMVTIAWLAVGIGPGCTTAPTGGWTRVRHRGTHRPASLDLGAARRRRVIGRSAFNPLG